MASAIVMSSPVHSISLPLGCSAVVEDPPPMEQTGTMTTSFIDLNKPRTLSPATSLDQLPRAVVAKNVDRPILTHSTPYPKAAQRQLPTPPSHGDSSDYILSQTPPEEIVIITGSPNSSAGSEGEQLDNRNSIEVAQVPDRDKWQFPVVDQPQRRNSGYDSDISDPSPYAVVKNIMMNVDPASSHDPPEVCHMDTRENYPHHEPGYEEIDVRCPPSLPSSRPHSRLGRHIIPSWQAFGMRGFEQPRSIRAALRETRGLPQMVQKHLRKADEHLQREQLKEAISCLEWSLVQTNEYPRIQSLIWMLLGNAHVGLGDFNRASICHLHYLAFCRERNDFPGITRAECNLGIAYMRLGLYKLAGRCFLQYLENCHLLQDDKGISVAYNNLGLLSKFLATEGYVAGMKEEARVRAEEMLKSNLNRAVSYFEQHLGLEEQFGNVNKQANAFGNLGTCNELLKQYTQAIFYHNKRLEICRSIGDRVTESCTLCNLGNCFRAIGKLEEALQYYILNLELTRSIEHKSGEMVTLLNLGTTYELLNKIDQAIEWYTLYLSMTVQKNDVPGQARGLCILASLYQEKRQLLKAHEYYKKLIGIFHQLGERDAEASAQQFMEMTKRAIEGEKEQNRSSKRKKRRYSKKAMTVSKASGLTLPNPATIEQQEGQQRAIPRPQRVKPPLTVDGIATLTAAQRTEFEKIRRKANIQSMDSLASACVFENPAYDHLREEYHNGYVPGLNPRPAVHNEYYQQWMQRRAGVEEATQLEAANGTRVSTSPVLSESGWSHIRTPGLSPESQVDWNYPNPYMCTFGVGFHLHPTTRSETAQSPQRVASPPFFPSINRACSPPVLSEGGYATVIRDRHNYDNLETEANFDETSIEDEEDEEEEGAMPAISVHVTQHDREDSRPSRTHVMQTVNSCSMIGSQRHLRELEKLSHDFTQPRVDQQLDLSEGVDKEWEQWVQMQEDDALTRVVSMRETGIAHYRNKYCRRPQRSLSCRPAVSAPQLGDELPISEENLLDDQDTSQCSSDA